MRAFKEMEVSQTRMFKMQAQLQMQMLSMFQNEVRSRQVHKYNLLEMHPISWDSDNLLEMRRITREWGRLWIISNLLEMLRVTREWGRLWIVSNLLGMRRVTREWGRLWIVANLLEMTTIPLESDRPWIVWTMMILPIYIYRQLAVDLILSQYFPNAC